MEFSEAIASANGLPIQRLRFLTSRMAESLRDHFKLEEERLWPHYENFNRALDASIRRRLEPGIKALVSDITANRTAVSQYLDARK